LTINLEFDGRPVALCDETERRQVGPNALVSLKKRSIPRNVGDPDEAFYVQTTSKAIGNLAAAGGSSHFGWQYWKWSPTKTTFSSAMGSFPPIFPWTGHLVAVTAATYRYSTTFSQNTQQVVLRVVKITPGSTAYATEDWTEDLRVTTSPALFVTDNTDAPLGTDPITPGQAISIRLTSVPGTLTGGARDFWLAVSVWVSHIQVET